MTNVHQVPSSWICWFHLHQSVHRGRAEVTNKVDRDIGGDQGFRYGTEGTSQGRPPLDPGRADRFVTVQATLSDNGINRTIRTDRVPTVRARKPGLAIGMAVTMWQFVGHGQAKLAG